MPIVSVQAAGRYDPEVLDRAVAAHFEALDVAGDLRPGMHPRPGADEPPRR